MSWLHDDGVINAVAPAGSPAIVRIVNLGKVVPVVGAMTSVYVAVPPGITVCVVIVPLAPIPVSGFKLKSRMDWSSTPPAAPAKFVSPP